MKDWSKKTYYTSSEMKEKLHNSILKLWEELINEIREEKLKREKFIKDQEKINNNQYNLCTV